MLPDALSPPISYRQLQDGSKNIPVGKVIALLAEEGDDISNLEAPKEEAVAPLQSTEASSSHSSSHSSQKLESDRVHSAGTHGPPSHAPTSLEHSRPLFPSVHRLLLEYNVANPAKIKGTGVRGMLTKGDVLTFVGKASNPLGTFKFGPSPIEEASKLVEKKKDVVQVRHIYMQPQLASEPSCVLQSLDGAAIRRLIVNSMLQGSIKASNPPPGMSSP